MGTRFDDPLPVPRPVRARATSHSRRDLEGQPPRSSAPLLSGRGARVPRDRRRRGRAPRRDQQLHGADPRPCLPPARRGGEPPAWPRHGVRGLDARGGRPRRAPGGAGRASSGSASGTPAPRRCDGDQGRALHGPRPDRQVRGGLPRVLRRRPGELQLAAGGGGRTTRRPACPRPAVCPSTACSRPWCWNDRDACEPLLARHGPDLAAVLVDPLSNRMGFIPPVEGSSPSSARPPGSTASCWSSTRSSRSA